ncbi:MAG: glycosyltransferase family 39 protein [Armatimonadota bacterium]|nr:glycosyltransferase family 39 protein [Armatimonadota bacterium]
MTRPPVRPPRAAVVALALLLLGIALPPRLWRLGSNPPGLGGDELGNIVPFLSIVRTGRDLDGRLLPMTFHRITRRPPIYGLLASPVVLVRGRDALSVRLPSVALGVAGLLLLWPLGDRLLGQRWAGATAAFVMAVTPWHIHYSRMGWEPATIIPLLSLALLLWVRAVEGGRPLAVGLAAGALGLTVYGYKAFEILAPLWLAVLLAQYRRRLTPRAAAAGGAAFALIMLPYAGTVAADPRMLQWPAQIFTFRDGVTAQTLATFGRNYLAHLAPGFLFVSGDPNPRHHAPGTGQLFWWTLPFLVLGLVELGRRADLPHRGLLAAWLFLFPLGGALTNDGVPHATRTLLGLPALCLVIGLGILRMISFIRTLRWQVAGGALAAAALAVAAAAEGVRFARAEYLDYPQVAGWWFDYGFPEVFQTIWAARDRYDRVCLWMVDWFHEPTFRAFYLEDFPLPVTIDSAAPACGQPGALVAVAAQALPPGAVLEHTVRAPNGSPLFLVYGFPR